MATCELVTGDVEAGMAWLLEPRQLTHLFHGVSVAS